MAVAVALVALGVGAGRSESAAPQVVAGTTTPHPPVIAAAADDVVGVASTVDGDGYWLTTARGEVGAFGSAAFLGDLRAVALTRPVVGIAATASGAGYWLVAGDGGIFAFGDAPFHGSTGAITLNRPVVSMAPTTSGHGYWMVASDGGVFSFGDASFHGSTGDVVLNQPVNGMTVSPTGAGYRMVAADGGVFSFGDAPFFGSTGAAPPASPIVGMAPAPGNVGYWTATGAGQVFAFGAAGHLGDLAGRALPARVVGLAANPTNPGYLVVLANGQAARFGAGAPPADPVDAPPPPGPGLTAPGTPAPPATAPPTAPPVTTPPTPTPATVPTTASGGPPAFTLRATLQAGVTAGQDVPADFLGLSLEWNLVEDYVGQGAEVSPVLVDLLAGLGPAGSLRLGGRSQDRACYGSHSFPLCDGAQIDAADLDALATLLRATGWRGIFGVNMAVDDDPAHAMQVDLVQALVARAGDVLHAVELGNEPNFYGAASMWPATPPRSSGYGVADAADDFTALLADLPGGVPVAGPALSSLQPLPAWFAQGPDLSRLAVVTAHMYAGHRTSTGERACTQDNLLNEGLMRHNVDGYLRSSVQAAALRGRPLRLGETTSCSGSGVAGVTDRQVGALWTLDWLLEAAQAGVAGVNVHLHDPPGVGDGTAHYDPIVSRRTATGWDVAVNPNYYGMAMLRPALGGRVLDSAALQVGDWDDLDLDQGFGAAAGRSGYPVKFHVVRTVVGGVVRRTVFVVNKEVQAVEVVLGASTGACLTTAPEVVRLTNTGGLGGAAAGTSLGARRVGGTAGPLGSGVLAAPVLERPAPSGGAVRLRVGVGEAVAATFTCGA